MIKKRTYIKVRRGLLEPKHFRAMGNAIWAYLYMVDHADWDTGIMGYWVDGDFADAMEIPPRTVRRMREALEMGGYIICEQKSHCQKITITNWVSPVELTASFRPDNDDEEPELEGGQEGVQVSGQVVDQVVDQVGNNDLSTLPIYQTSNIIQVEMDKQQENELLAKTYQNQNASTPGIEKYPEEVQEVISLFCELYTFKPPLKGKKEGAMAFWIMGARELIEAAGEFGLDAIREQRKDFEAHMATHGGIAPFKVLSPKSIVNDVRGKAATMREARPSNSGFRFDW